MKRANLLIILLDVSYLCRIPLLGGCGSVSVVVECVDVRGPPQPLLVYE